MFGINWRSCFNIHFRFFLHWLNFDLGRRHLPSTRDYQTYEHLDETEYRTCAIRYYHDPIHYPESECRPEDAVGGARGEMVVEYQRWKARKQRKSFVFWD